MRYQLHQEKELTLRIVSCPFVLYNSSCAGFGTGTRTEDFLRIFKVMNLSV